ncbi:MAG TPA: tetratricopeptide repeat protein, partial [Candidatus Acidoferrales bacterium]
THAFPQAEEQFIAASRLAPQSFDAHLELGSFYNATGKFDQAEPALRAALRLRPADPEARMQLSVSLVKLRRYAEAEEVFARLKAPEDPAQRVVYLRLKASIDFGAEKKSSAADDMEEALRMNPGDPSLLLAAAVADAQAERWRAVINHLKPSFQDEQNPVAALTLLQAQLATHADPGATLAYLHGMQMEPADALELRLRLGQMLSGAEMHTGAAEEFRAATLLAPDRSDLYFNLALEEYRSRNYQQARTDAAQAQSLADSADIESLLGDIEEDSGDYLAAVKSYQAAASMAPDTQKYQLALGLEFLRHQNFEPALAVFQRSVQRWPESVESWLGLGMAQFIRGSYGDAAATLQKAADMQPHSEIAVRYLGITQFEQPDAPSEAAINRVCHFAEGQPKNSSALTYCGALMLRHAAAAGDNSSLDKIIRLLGEAERIDPSDSLAVCQRGKAYVSKSDWPAAQSEFESCVRLDPDSAEGHYWLMRVDQRLGRTDEAAREETLYQSAHQKMADDIARRDASMKTFLIEMGGNKPQ